MSRASARAFGFGAAFGICATGLFIISGALTVLRLIWHGEVSTASLVWGLLGCAVLSSGFALLLAGTHHVFQGMAGTLFLGTSGNPRPPLNLSGVRALIKQERFEEARSALDVQWAAYPGNGELLREYERFFLDGLGAYVGATEFLTNAVPLLTGKDRAYVYMRIAEILWEKIEKPQEAGFWCRRLLGEFPDSVYAPAARSLLNDLKVRCS